tara:strand:+ start:114 stop:362 length:249 start_codon:yes stop_codon:yes gene_type:complete
MYEVEKNIPITNPKDRTGKTNFLRNLSVGDSFVISENDKKTERTNWHVFAKRLGMKIVTRTLNNDQEIRIWVVEKDGVKLDE